MRKRENGYIMVEFIGTFIPLVLLVFSILTLVNVVVVQSRVHYAMTQAANTMSMYSYVLEVTGAANNLNTLSNQANEGAVIIENIDKVMDGISSLSGPGDVIVHGPALAERALDTGAEILDDPKKSLQHLMNYGLNEARNKLLADLLVRPMVGRYLSNGAMSGDAYLRSFGVIGGLDGLDMDGTVIIDENDDIKLVSNYEIEYKFGALPLPFQPKLKVKQTVITKAWLNGSGKGYW